MSISGSPSVAFLENLPDNALVTDDRGRLVQANGRARSMLALGTGPWTATLAELFPFRDPDLGPRALTGEEQPPFEDIARGLDGREYRVLVRVGPASPGSHLWLVTDLSREQNDRQGMIDYMADLTKAQNKIREYTRQIEVFRQVVNGMDQGIILTDADQKIVFANAFANDLFGRELAGKPVSEMTGLLSSASDGQKHHEVPRGEVLVLDEVRGRQTRCYLNVAPLSREDPTDHGLVWTYFELTEEIANTQAFIDFSAELAVMNRDLRIKNEQILHLSRTDVLTGMANRRSILEVLDKSVEFAVERRQDLSIVLLDIDRFKEVNDKRGHLAGDEAIRQVCTFASQVVGAYGTMGRYGGEEFLIVFPGIEKEQARVLAEEVRSAVQKGTIDKGFGVTVTLGVSGLKPEFSGDIDTLLSEADVALYQGKAAGRNRVVVAP